MIPGGSDNKINSTANYSFVAGQRGVANNVGTFIWSDYDDLEHNLIQGQKEFQSTTNNTFLIRALNGMAINTNTVNPGVNVAVNGTISLGSEGKLAQSCSGANGALLSGTLESRNGCMYYCDGKYRQLLNRKNDEIVQRCGENAPGTYKPNIAYKFCMLKENIDGSIYSIEYEPGETVVAYPQRVANSCTSQVITCNQNGQWTAHPTGGEWSIKCLAGSGASTPITYGCIGHVPNNADVCAGDEGGTFTTDVLRTIATTGCTTAKKCEYTCKANYHKDPTSQNCLPDIQTFTCGVKPAGSVWNMGVNNGSYPQTRNGSAWIPANTSPTYNTTASASECRYKCPVNYTRNGTSCTIPTRTFTCTAKPASNTQWNTVSSYTQTQINGVWTPADSTTQYNSEASATSCRYTCASGYIRNGSSCQKSSCDARSYSVGSRTYTLPSIGHGEAITRNPNTNPVDNTPTNGKTSYSAIFTCSYGTWTYEEDAVVTCNSGYSRNAAGACVQKCLPANKTVNGRDYALGETDVGDTHSAMSTNSPLIGLPANGTSRYNMTFMCSNGSRSNGPVELPNSLDCSHYDQNNNYDDSRTYDVYNSQGGVYSNGQEAVSFCCNKGYEVSGTTCQPKSCPGQARTVNGHTYTVITIAHSQTYTTSPTGTP
ncbi:MAG: hypothetical protein LBD11_05960 [Candidatus Peribacteria bacterium]|nr:hypothetical protein [Candidatus Peribacteria bacterium]